MSLVIKTSKFSFLQFYQPADINCGGQTVDLCLPIFDKSDLAFQFVLEADTQAAADYLCDIDNSLLTIGIKLQCQDGFFSVFTLKTERYRISDRQILYNWQHGLGAGFDLITIGHCFYVAIHVNIGYTFYEWCSNCFQKIGSDCHTSVLEYGNTENAFDFNYCNSGVVDENAVADCSPTEITFPNLSTLTIPYTAALAAKYGPLPTVQVWIYAPDGTLQDMGISSKFDAYPVSNIIFDFGGPASGVIKIM